MADQSLTNEQVAALAVIEYLVEKVSSFERSWDGMPDRKRVVLRQGLESVIDRAYRSTS